MTDTHADPYCGLMPLDPADVPEALTRTYPNGRFFAPPDGGPILAYWARTPDDSIPWIAMCCGGKWVATPEAALEAVGLDPAALDQMRLPTASVACPPIC